MLSVSSWLYVASSVINHGMFYGPGHVPEKQRLKATSTKLKEKWETAKNIRSEGVEVQTNQILPQTYSSCKHEGKKRIYMMAFPFLQKTSELTFILTS